jgi:hypothetical protein
VVLWLGFPNQGEVWTSTAPQKEAAIVRLLVVTAMLAYAILQWCVHDVVASGELMLCPELCKSADVLFHFAGRMSCMPSSRTSYMRTPLLQN